MTMRVAKGSLAWASENKPSNWGTTTSSMTRITPPATVSSMTG